ncbi:hypothetical protein SISSUDRAFT_410746 [Sistotremastrum suecicum HHB10207 ss-3]|uniref:Uncharacterized protein n=1 Tax=Sistotremastrum suecicum HHB10207 ss-3 TaxID=1314776 RepID=A0A165YNU8_9AGAM|nr:hypothetical protein SISSUDRAFT_410746 [Sistotremastrum suecicum HHB10207 ss-3]
MTSPSKKLLEEKGTTGLISFGVPEEQTQRPPSNPWRLSLLLACWQILRRRWVHRREIDMACLLSAIVNLLIYTSLDFQAIAWSANKSPVVHNKRLDNRASHYIIRWKRLSFHFCRSSFSKSLLFHVLLAHRGPEDATASRHRLAYIAKVECRYDRARIRLFELPISRNHMRLIRLRKLFDLRLFLFVSSILITNFGLVICDRSGIRLFKLLLLTMKRISHSFDEHVRSLGHLFSVDSGSWLLVLEPTYATNRTNRSNSV